jgi:hypothetical protein
MKRLSSVWRHSETLHRSGNCLQTAQSARVVFFAAWLLAAVGCGARPGVGPIDEQGTPTVDGGGVAPDGSAPPADAAVLAFDAAPLAPCVWTAAPVYQLTDPPHDKGLHTVSVTQSNVRVAWQITNPDPPAANTRRLQKLSFTGEAQNDAETLFPAPGAWNLYGGIRLATGPQHFGATVWDEAHGCLFRPLDAAGNIAGDYHRIADLNCGVLRSTAQGFSLFLWDTAAQQKYFVTLDAQGRKLTESGPIDVLFGEVFWWASTVLADETLLVAAMVGGLSPTHIQVGRIDAQGAPLTPPHTVTTLSVDASRVRLIRVPGGALLGWFETPADAPSHQHQRIVFQPLDENGHPTTPAVRYPTYDAYRDAGWSLARWADGVLAAFVEPLENDNYGDRSKVMFQPFTAQGTPAGPAVALSEERFARDPLIRRTPLGAIIVYSAYPDNYPHELFAGAVRCER